MIRCVSLKVCSLRLAQVIEINTRLNIICFLYIISFLSFTLPQSSGARQSVDSLETHNTTDLRISCVDNHDTYVCVCLCSGRA